MKKKFICTVCGYIYEGETAPEQCPLCKAGAEKFKEYVEKDGDAPFAAEHSLGIAKGIDPEIIEGLKAHAAGECSEAFYDGMCSGCAGDARWGQSQELADGRFWAAEPDVGRVAHGVPARVDRLKCIGNAVVPQQACPIFRALKEELDRWT